LIIIVSYLPWIILDSWKSNKSINCFVWLALLNFRSQFLTSHTIFNCYAYTQWVDRIIFCKSSSFFIHDVAFRSTLPMPHALKPNTCNNCFGTNLTKVSFGNGGHCFATIISLSHSCCVLARTQLTTFWSFHLCITMAFPKMQTFILSWCWWQGLLLKVKGLQGLAFSTTKPCTFFKCLVDKQFGIICNNENANFTIPFRPKLHPFFVLLNQIRWTKGCQWLRNLVSFKFRM